MYVERLYSHATLVTVEGQFVYDENFYGDTLCTLSPNTNNFCLYLPPTSRCFWKDFLMTLLSHQPTSNLFHCYPHCHCFCLFLSSAFTFLLYQIPANSLCCYLSFSMTSDGSAKLNYLSTAGQS